MKNQRDNLKFYLFIVLAFIVGVFVGIFLGGRDESLVSAVVNDLPIDSFASVVGPVDDLNNGIILEPGYRKLIQLEEIETGNSSHLELQVIMNGPEDIIFADQMYGLRAYYESKHENGTTTWRQVNMGVIFMNTKEVILGRNTNLSGEKNIGYLLAFLDGLGELDQEENVRFYVTGVGVESGKVYGAYLDVPVVKQDDSD